MTSDRRSRDASPRRAPTLAAPARRSWLELTWIAPSVVAVVAFCREFIDGLLRLGT